MLLGKIFRKLVRWANKNLSGDGYPGDPINSFGVSSKSSMPSPAGTLSGNGNNGMNFVVYGATGGKVIEFSTYDPHTSRSTRNLYIVTDKEDLGEELAQIITIESLTR